MREEERKKEWRRKEKGNARPRKNQNKNGRDKQLFSSINSGFIKHMICTLTLTQTLKTL